MPHPLTIIKVSHSSIFSIKFPGTRADVTVLIITGPDASIGVTVRDLWEWGRLGGGGLGGGDVDRGDEVIAC